MTRIKSKKHFNLILITIILGMMLTSLIAINCASSNLPAYLNVNTLLFKQTLFYIIGFIIIIICAYFIDNDLIIKISRYGYIVCLALLGYLLIDVFLQKIFHHSVLPLVEQVNGATAWLKIPFIGNFQPSEFIKIFLIVLVADAINEHQQATRLPSLKTDIELFIKVFKIAILPLIFILLEPDTGMFLIIFITIVIMLLFSNIQKCWTKYLLITIACFLLLTFLCFKFFPSLFHNLLGNGYRVRRFYGWLDPEAYKNSDGLQLYSSLLAIGNGGINGTGFKKLLINIPEAHTDFIFAIIAQCFGFIGSLIILFLCFSLDFRLLTIAFKNTYINEKLFIIGFTTILLLQQIQNIGMVIGLLPITGITLPLISYGGSSILSYMIAIGFTNYYAQRLK